MVIGLQHLDPRAGSLVKNFKVIGLPRSNLRAGSLMSEETVIVMSYGMRAIMEIENYTSNLTVETFVIPRTRMLGVFPSINLGNPGSVHHRTH